MKKILQKSLSQLRMLLLLAVMFVAGSSAWAQDPDAEFSITGKNNTTQQGTVNGVNWTCHLEAYKGGANFYAYDSDLFTVEAPDSKVITKIVMTLCDQTSVGGTATLDRDGGDVGELVYAGGKATWTGESDYVKYTRTGSRDWSFNYVEVWLADAGADDGSVKSTLNFDSWNLSYSGGSTKPASSTHFYNGEVFSNAEGVTMTLTNIPDPQAWPSECFYSNPSGSTMALYLCNGEGFTIAAPDGYKLTKILVNRASTYSMTSLIIDGVQNADATKGTWTGEATSVPFSTISGNSDNRILISNILVTLMPTALAEDVEYTVNFVGAPAGAEVTLDDQTLTADNNTYEVAKKLGEGDLVVVDPSGYWTEVAFDGEHTYTVTYHAYYYYNVTVSGAAGGALIYGEDEYTGGQIESKAVLTLGSVSAKKVAGYDAEVAFDGTTFTVTYTAYPTVAIGSNAVDNEGNYWTTFSFHHPVSFAEGVTPCIVTGAENGALTVEEIETVNSEVTTTLDFMNGTVIENASRLFDESGNAADVTVVRSGGRIESQYLGLYYSSYPTLTITSNGTEPISKIIVTPWGWGSGYCCSLNGGEIVDVPNDPYTFNVNASSCTLAFTPRDGSSIYVTKIEIVVGGEIVPVFPANTGILVKSDAANANVAYTVHEVGEVNVDASDNLLVAGNTTPSYGWDNANKLYYKLAWASSAYDNLGFYWGVDGGHSITPNANKAYLVLDAAAASNFRAFTFDGNDTITAIEGITSEADNAPVYNLQGQRVNAAKAGIYVKNGRKFIVK